MKKVILGIIMVLGIVVGYKYYQVNKDVPNEYKLDSYNLEDEIILDETSIKVNNYKIHERNIKEDGDDNIDLILNVTIKNITKNIINLREVLTSTKIGYKTYYQDYSEVFGDFSKIKNLKPQESIDLEINYLLFKNEIEQLGKGDVLKFYPPKSSFKNQIAYEYNEGYLYGKYVGLGE